MANGGRVVVFPADSLRGMVGRTVRSVLWVALAVLALTLIVAVVIGRWISKPIVAVSGRIASISDSLDLQQRVEVTVRNEVGDMTASSTSELTEMAGRLEGFLGQFRV